MPRRIDGVTLLPETPDAVPWLDASSSGAEIVEALNERSTFALVSDDGEPLALVMRFVTETF
jgi:hypothetical protein